MNHDKYATEIKSEKTHMQNLFRIFFSLLQKKQTLKLYFDESEFFEHNLKLLGTKYS